MDADDFFDFSIMGPWTECRRSRNAPWTPYDD